MPNPTIALDLGTLRIGVAITDPLGYTVQPLLTIYRKSRGEDLRNITRLAHRHAADRILIGNPLHLSGDPSPWSKQVQEFTAELQKRTETPIELVDERLTSEAAHEILNEAGHNPRDREKRKKIIDQLAAVLILESWLQQKQQQAARPSDPLKNSSS